MDIKLLEQLKKSGLPQEGGIMIAHGTRIAHTPDHCYCPRCTGEEYVKDPTLEELIDWCVKKLPDGDFHLEARYGKWQASGCLDKKGNWMNWNKGKTPLLAVAKLGLALHKEV